MNKQKFFLKRNLFGKLTCEYTSFCRGYPKKVYQIIFKNIPDKNARVLDLACDTGISTKPLLYYYKHVYRADKEKEIIQCARNDFKKHGLKAVFKVASADNLPFQDNFFNLITIAQAFHWFAYKKALQEIKLVLKDDGYLVIYSKQGARIGYFPEYIYKIIQKYTNYHPRKTIQGPKFKDILRQNDFKILIYKKIKSPDKYIINDFNRVKRLSRSSRTCVSYSRNIN